MSEEIRPLDFFTREEISELYSKILEELRKKAHDACSPDPEYVIGYSNAISDAIKVVEREFWRH